MGFLTNLLPGLRDIRAPLAAGYAWLLGVWLIGGMFPAATAVLRRLTEVLGPLTKPLGSGVAVAATTVVAYLLGSVFTSQPVARYMRRIPGFNHPFKNAWLWTADRLGDRRRRHPFAFDDILTQLSLNRSFTYVDLYRLAELVGMNSIMKVATEADVRSRKLVPSMDEYDPHNNFLRNVMAPLRWFDTQAAGVRLHLANKDLWDQYDRLLGEGQLRLALAPPLLLVAVGLGLRVSPWAGVVLVVLAVLLHYAGEDRARAANGVLVQCVSTGVISDEILHKQVKTVRSKLKSYCELLDEIAASSSDQKVRGSSVLDLLLESRRLWIDEGTLDGSLPHSSVNSQALG